ncbi:hypothetical protein CIRG_05083 [Coccidioides immitis RMSCC 2394]|uniref:Uncharacterized protein n=1 Tax=Coccidioides immitis RMSCC 2394 TaxID=404692 RepID=A0A0J7B642_COCIT|nr:hypothetical protein CIRG_05083 [Coccidioides immitis RMSCC 2394]
MAFPVFSLLLKSTLLELSKTRDCDISPRDVRDISFRDGGPITIVFCLEIRISFPHFGYRAYGFERRKPPQRRACFCNAIAIAEVGLCTLPGNPTFSGIMLFGQSLGTAVGVSFERLYAFETQPVHLAGMLLSCLPLHDFIPS